MLPWLEVSARIVNRRCTFTRLRHTLPAEDGPAANISFNLASIFTHSRGAGNRANGHAWSIPVLRVGLSCRLIAFGLQVRVGPESIPSVPSTLPVNSPQYIRWMRALVTTAGRDSTSTHAMTQRRRSVVDRGFQA